MGKCLQLNQDDNGRVPYSRPRLVLYCAMNTFEEHIQGTTAAGENLPAKLLASNQENPGFCGFSPTPAAGPAFPCALPMPLVLGSSVVGDIAPL